MGGLAFVLAVAVLASRTCESEMATAAIRFRVGDAGAGLRVLRADLFRGQDPEPVAFYERRYDERGSGDLVGPWNLRADPGMYRLEVHAQTATGPIEATRAIEIADGRSITVEVEPDPGGR